MCTTTGNDNETCATQFASDHFSCHNNSRLVYVARVVGTIQTNVTTFLEYLSVLGPVEISLYNQTLSVISSPSCPLLIPSAEESNCSPLSVIDNTNTTYDNNNTITDNATNVTMTTNEPSNDIVMVTIVALSCFIGIILMTFCIVSIMYICSRCNNYHGDIER